MEIYFQKGEYPIRQVIYSGVDSVIGGLATGGFLKPKYGKVDVIHQITSENNLSPGVTVEKLLLTTKSVVSTCWIWGKNGFNAKLLDRYCKERGWPEGSVRVYVLFARQF